eukprot:gene10634-7566_t
MAHLIKDITRFLNISGQSGNRIEVNPYTLSAGITLSYIAFYTAYDKASKSLNGELLKDFFFVRRGYDWTLKEANKVISLSGLTSLLLAFTPEFHHVQKDLLYASMGLLWTHSIYSFYSFYDFSLKKVWNDKLLKPLSVALGAAGHLLLSYSFFGKIDDAVLAVSTTALSIAHFWTMEVDYKYKLQVRPFAYLPFPLSIYAIYRALTPSK